MSVVSAVPQPPLTGPQTAFGFGEDLMRRKCQAILARTVFPCQDTPSVRFTYDAVLRIPRGLAAVMASMFGFVKSPILGNDFTLGG